MLAGDLALIAAGAGFLGGLVGAVSRWASRVGNGTVGSRALARMLWEALTGGAAGSVAFLLVTAIREPAAVDRFSVAAYATLAGLFSPDLARALAGIGVAVVGMDTGSRSGNRLDDIERDIRSHIAEGSSRFHFGAVDDSVWVVKYLAPRWLGSFMAVGKLGTSRTPGFTWGDGVYLAPIGHAYSSAMYGRAAVVGFLQRADVAHVYDAVDPKGVELYQRWIRTRVNLYRQLTTTIHADAANQLLRNIFRQHFDIQLVVFEADEAPAGYVSAQASWFCVTDWTQPTPGQSFVPTTLVRDCRFVAIVGEEFAQVEHHANWPRYLAAAIGTPGPIAWDDQGDPRLLEQPYKDAHQANAPAAGVSPPHPVNRLVHVRPVS